jgi:hypothetical protein
LPLAPEHLLAAAHHNVVAGCQVATLGQSGYSSYNKVNLV